MITPLFIIIFVVLGVLITVSPLFTWIHVSKMRKEISEKQAKMIQLLTVLTRDMKKGGPTRAEKLGISDSGMSTAGNAISSKGEDASGLGNVVYDSRTHQYIRR